MSTVEAALTLAARGWHVFPVDHPDLPVCAGVRTRAHDPATCPREKRGKHPCGKWSQMATTDPASIVAMFSAGPRNIGIACKPSGLLVVDEDALGDFARYAAEHGHQIPSTFTQTTRVGRKHFFFRAPVGEVFGNSEGALKSYGINIRGGGACDGGYVVGPGSKHVTGAIYSPNGVTEVAEAPEWLREALRTPERPETTAATPGEPGEMIPYGHRYDTLMRYACSLRERMSKAEAHRLFYVRWLDCVQPPGTVPEASYHEEPPAGVSSPVATWESALGILDDVWRRYPTAGERETERIDSYFGKGTTDKLTVKLNVQQSPNGTHEGSGTPVVTQEVEDAFWSARPVLAHVRAFALARRASPWATLGVVLIRVVAATPPRVVLPPLIGGVASLNLFAGLVGRSGDGKGAAMAAGTEAVDLGPLGMLNGTVIFAVHTPGSGQGIGHAYARYEKGLGMVRYAESAVFDLAEIDHLAGLSGQSGSTLMPELRRLYMGERLGHLYVDVHKRVEIAAHTYRAGFIAGIQPARAGVLLDDADGGTPQRWLWFPVAYPHADKRPAEPAPWQWQPPTWVPDTVPAFPEPATPVYAPAMACKPGEAPPPVQPVMPTVAQHRVTLAVPECAASAIDVAHLARARGGGDPLDGHKLLCREKVAAALAILDGRPEVNVEDWELAGVVCDVSDATRDGAVAVLRTKAAGQNVAKAQSEAVRAVVVEDAKEAHAVARVAHAVLRHLAAADEWVSRKDLRAKLAGRDRGHLDAALDHLLGAGQVEAEEVPGQGQNGTRYRLTREKS